MSVDDAQIAWIRKRKFISPHDMMGIIANVGSISSGATEVDIGGFGVVGYTMVAGEFISGAIQIPWDLDPKFEIGFKVVYSIDVNASAPATTWIVQYDLLAADIAYALPTTALDTPIAVHTKPGTVDDTHLVTARGILLPGTHGITRAMIEADDRIMLEVEMDAVTNTPTLVNYVGLIIDYAPQRCGGVGSENDAPLAVADYL